MVNPIISVGIGLAILAYLLADDEEMQRIKKGANGQVFSVHKLAFAYWNKYTATYVPKSQWILMNREEKSNVIRKREELEQLLANFDVPIQTKVMSVRPRDFASPKSSRIEDAVPTSSVPFGFIVGRILTVHCDFGYLRPGRTNTSYYFHRSQVLGEGIQALSPGALVFCKLGENNKGLCATDVRKSDDCS